MGRDLDSETWTLPIWSGGGNEVKPRHESPVRIEHRQPQNNPPALVLTPRSYHGESLFCFYSGVYAHAVNCSDTCLSIRKPELSASSRWLHAED
jgi:hypothetical protein